MSDPVRINQASLRTGIGVNLFIAALFALLEGPIYLDQWAHELFIPVHLFVLSVLYLLYKKYKVLGFDLRILNLTWVLTVASGIFGSFIMILICFYYPHRSKRSKTFIQWYASIFPGDTREEEDILYERIMTEREDYTTKMSLVPFRDAMAFGTQLQKSQAISKILRYFNPHFSHALVQGLNDLDPVIRVRAATAVAYLEDKYTHLILKQKHALELDPQDKRAMLNLAEVLQSYSKCEFVNEETRLQYVERALRAYKEYLQLDPQDDEIKLRIAKLYFQLNRYDEAEKIYLQLIEQSGIFNAQFLRGYLELLFAQKKYDRIRTVCQEEFSFLDKVNESTFRLKEIVNLWKIESEAMV